MLKIITSKKTYMIALLVMFYTIHPANKSISAEEQTITHVEGKTFFTHGLNQNKMFFALLFLHNNNYTYAYSGYDLTETRIFPSTDLAKEVSYAEKSNEHTDKIFLILCNENTLPKAPASESSFCIIQ